jgi:hypothetical protein
VEGDSAYVRLEAAVGDSVGRAGGQADGRAGGR